jgi:hypothetical protein
MSTITCFDLWMSKGVYDIFLPPLDMDNRSRVNSSLGGTTRNNLNEWLKNQKQPNHFFGPFLLSVFIIIIFFSCLSIECFNIWLEVYLGILKIGKKIKFIFLIKMAP